MSRFARRIERHNIGSKRRSMDRLAKQVATLEGEGTTDLFSDGPAPYKRKPNGDLVITEPGTGHEWTLGQGTLTGHEAHEQKKRRGRAA